MIDLDRLCRAEWGHLLSSLIRSFGDFDLAEEALQEAFAQAVVDWPLSEPNNPKAWLYGTARHRAIDRLRRRARSAVLLGELEPFDERHVQSSRDEATVPDERLRLIFTCCHPALAEEAQVALALRTLGGLSTEEIARAFLVPQATMAQRLVRAKAKIREASIPYAIPEADELPDRLGAVMSVLYLIFNEGYVAAQGKDLVRQALCKEAIELTRLLRSLLGARLNLDAPEVDALLALMLLQDSRRDARIGAHGEVVLLEAQARTLWDRAEIDEGIRLLDGALQRAPPGTYALEAAIAALHAESARAEDTDWRQIAALYQRLLELHPSPVVALNRAVAIAMAEGPEAALPLVTELEAQLSRYNLWHAARADLLRRLGHTREALSGYERARELSQNESELRFFARRIAELEALL
ncbi:MAG TPA: RNA polymerase sigma factor [Polyangiaceae bacterium]|nr:RNA polymerase sigma factor [Polyangiaceae bacterium]